MNVIKKTLTGIAMALAITGATSANATLTNWRLNPLGTGIGGSILVQDFVDLTGTSYVNNSFTSTTTFNSQEAGVFNQLSVDGGPSSGGQLIVPALSSTFTGTASGSTTTGILTFNPGGILDIFTGAVPPLTAPPVASAFAEFVLQQGSANLVANSTLPNGTVSLIFQATRLNAGYFFDSLGVDLSTQVSNGLLFGFVTTNVISLANGSRQIGPTLSTLYNNAFNPDVLATTVGNNTTDLLLSNNGQIRLNTVPEPATLAMLGLGMLGFARMKRSRA